MSNSAERKLHRLTPEDRHLIREIARDRVRLQCELDLACIERREILDTMRWRPAAQRTNKELLTLEVQIDSLKEQLERITTKAVADKWDLKPNHVSQLTTVKYR